MVNTFKVSMMGKGPLIYRSNGPMCQMNYSDDLEKDGTFGEVAKAAWATAASEWRRYGDEGIQGALKGRDPIEVRLNDKESHEEAVKQLLAQLEAFQPGLREKIVADRRAGLTEAQREAFDTPPEKRTGRQAELAAQAADAVQVTDDEVARLVPATNRKEAMKIAKEIIRHRDIVEYIDSERGIVNFEYWRMRANVEQTEDMLNARRQIYQGDQAYAENNLVAARNAYNQGFEGWRKVIDKYPMVGEPLAEGDDLMIMVRRYRRILNQLDEPFPDHFILQDIVEANRNRGPGAQSAEGQQKSP